MPSTHGPIFYRRLNIRVKIGSCALTFAPIKIRTFPSDNWSALKNRYVCADFSPIKNPAMGPHLPLSQHYSSDKKSDCVCQMSLQ